MCLEQIAMDKYWWLSLVFGISLVSPALPPREGDPEGVTGSLCPTDEVVSTPVNYGNSQFPHSDLV